MLTFAYDADSDDATTNTYTDKDDMYIAMALT